MRLSKKLLFIPLLTILCCQYAMAQTNDLKTKISNAEVLIVLLYTTEEFQERFSNALENHPAFEAYAEDKYFISKLVEEVPQSALGRYIGAVERAVAKLSESEIDNLITILESPGGEVIKKMFVYDNQEVEKELAQYIGELVDYGINSLEVRDSILYAKVFPYDLKEVMIGDYINDFGTFGYTEIERGLDMQTERYEDETYKFSITWVNNSKYVLTDVPGNPKWTGDDLTVNIYEIDGDAYHYIWQNVDGSYGKDVIERKSYSSPEAEVKVFRWALDDHYLDELTSPLKDETLERFREKGGHDFFAYKEKYRVIASFEPSNGSIEDMVLSTSNGQTVSFKVAGTASFKLEDQSMMIYLYESNESGEDDLFLPFQDHTSGSLSYGGGRYINVERPENAALIIDFNKSYNPYCAYTDGYACPIPPAENQMEIKIEAGIKAPK